MALTVSACQRRIDLGDLPQEVGESAGTSGVLEPPEDPSEFPERLLFSSGFDSGDLSDWGIEAASLETAGGVFSADAELSQVGRHAGKVVVDALDEHVVLSQTFAEQELMVGLWLRLQDTYSTANWPFLHIDQVEESGTRELWDLGFDASGDGEQRLFLWEKPLLSGTDDGSRIADASESFGIERWVYVQVHLLARSDTSGFLRVYQDDVLVLEVANRPTSLAPEIRLSFGSYISSIEPLPAVLWVDEVTVYGR